MVKVKKIRLSLSLINHRAIKMYGGVEVELHAFLTFAIDRNKFQFHVPAVLLRGGGGNRMGIEGWVGTTAGLDGAEPREIFLLQGIEHGFFGP
jgi:hypothetical protein